MIPVMLDTTIKLFLLVLVFLWLFTAGSIFEVEYYDKLVELYTHPWWRWLLIALVIVSASWCPSLAIIFTLAIFFYFADIQVVIN